MNNSFLKKTSFLVIFSFFLLALFIQAGTASAQNASPEKIRVVYFYAVDCPECQKIKPFLEEIKKEYGDRIDFLEYDVKEKEGCRQLFYHFISKYNVPDKQAGTPLIFVGKKYLSGPDSIEQNLKKEIEQKIAISENLLFDCHEFLRQWPNVEKIDFQGGGGGEVCSINAEFCSIEDGNSSNDIKTVSLALIVTTAAIDSINPCAIAVLIFLITILVSLKTSRARMLKIGFFYIGAVFATYYLAGLGIIRIITQFNIANEIGIVAGMVVLLAGLLEIKEGLYPDGKQLLRIPKSTKPIFVNFLKKGTVPSVIIAGILVSAFELPCTGQVYLAILSMLSTEGLKSQGYFYLFIYNVIFVLPLIILLIVAAWGFDIKRMDNMRNRTKMTVKIFIGLIMLALGLFLLFQDRLLAMLGF